MLTRKEKARLTKAMRINEGLYRDMNVIDIYGAPRDKYILMSEEAFKQRFTHYSSERISNNTLRLTVRMNGFRIITLVNPEDDKLD